MSLSTRNSNTETNNPFLPTRNRIQNTLRAKSNPTNIRAMKRLQLKSKRYGRLIPVRFHHRARGGQAMWLCRCACGKSKIARAADLNSGATKSCGCIHATVIKHGNARLGKNTKEYRIWAAMKQRCQNPNALAYPRYGARGITVCKRWQKFQNFLKDMGRKPRRLTLGRKDSRLGYCPENCRWETYRQQNTNPTNSNRINRTP